MLTEMIIGDEPAAACDWRKYDKPEDEIDDDEVLTKTPEDVVELLGFDPLEIENE